MTFPIHHILHFGSNSGSGSDNYGTSYSRSVGIYNGMLALSIGKRGRKTRSIMKTEIEEVFISSVMGTHYFGTVRNFSD